MSASVASTCAVIAAAGPLGVAVADRRRAARRASSARAISSRPQDGADRHEHAGARLLDRLRDAVVARHPRDQHVVLAVRPHPVGDRALRRRRGDRLEPLERALRAPRCRPSCAAARPAAPPSARRARRNSMISSNSRSRRRSSAGARDGGRTRCRRTSRAGSRRGPRPPARAPPRAPSCARRRAAAPARAPAAAGRRPEVPEVDRAPQLGRARARRPGPRQRVRDAPGVRCDGIGPRLICLT